MNKVPFFVFEREIDNEPRLIKVIESVPKLEIRYRKSNRGVPSIRVWFWNDGGVTKWKYLHSGLIGMDALEEKLKGYGARAFEEIE